MAELTATVGAEVIVTVVVTALPVHPSVLVPITLYVEVVTGDTAILDVVAEVLHEYVFAPEATRVAVAPLQMV